MSSCIDEYFEAIKAGDSSLVRKLLNQDRSLACATKSKLTYKLDAEMELESYKFLGAYLGSLSGLFYALLIGNDSIARDIIDASFKEDLDIVMGGGNTALHLAAFLGARDLVKIMLERGANPNAKNVKGFSPVDLVDDSEMSSLFTTMSRMENPIEAIEAC